MDEDGIDLEELSYDLITRAVFLVIDGSIFHFALLTVYGKDVPWYWDIVGGVVIEPVSFAIALACGLVNTFGGPTPLLP